MDVTVNKFELSPVAWWLHLGTAIQGHVLICGDLSRSSILYLSCLCEKVYLLNYSSCDFYGNNNIVKIEKDHISEKKYDAIIADRYNGSCNVSDEYIVEIIQNNLKKNGMACLFEKNIYSISNKNSNFYQKIINVFVDKRLSFFKMKGKGLLFEKLQAITYDDTPYESFQEGSYSTNKNTFKFKGKVKSWLMKTKFSRLISNSSIWVFSNNNCNNKSIVDVVVKYLKERPYMKMYNNLQISIIYYKAGKLIFSLKDTLVDGDFIVVIALDNESIKQRSNEKNTIENLRENKRAKHLVIDQYYEEDILGFKSYIMKAYPGYTVDMASDRTECMIKNAFSALMEITYSTLETGLNITKQNRLVSSYFDIMFQRMPDYFKSVNIIKEYVFNEMNEHNITTVCMHGDFKLENCVLDTSFSVAGIIDWELSELKGLPLIDLLYLIIYNHQIVEQIEFEQAFLNILNFEFYNYEKDMLAEYCKVMSINKQLMLLLIAVFFIHHYSCRYLILPRSHILSDFEKCLYKIINLIETREA